MQAPGAAAGNGLVLALVVGLLFAALAAGQGFPYVSPGTCVAPEFFDARSLECKACTAEGTVWDAGENACVCARGLVRSVDPSSGSTVCTACAAGLSATRDQTQCQACAPGGAFVNTTSAPGTTSPPSGGNGTSTATTDALYDSGSSACVCANANAVLVEENAMGDLLPNKLCTPCGSRFYRDGDEAYDCTPCPDPHMSYDGTRCVCDAPDYTAAPSGTQCLWTAHYTDVTGEYSIESAATVSFDAIVEDGSDAPSVSVVSAVFEDLFPRAATTCKYATDTVGCQTLANLCVLQMYDEEAPACELFVAVADAAGGDTHNFDNWAEAMPWLYYTNVASVINSFDIPLRVTFSTELAFVLAGYHLNGTFAGFADLGDQLQLCPDLPARMSSFLRFGTNYENECVLDSAALLAAGEPMFYDLYLSYEGDDGTTELYPVPVRVQNLLDAGREVNINEEDLDDVLTRRFFLWDGVSGKRTLDTPAEVLRVADYIQISTMVQSDTTGYIHPPILTIHYTERKLASAEAGTDAPTVSFSSQYEMDLESFWRTAMMVFIVATIVVGILWFVRFWGWTRRNQSTNDFGALVVRIVVYLASAGARVYTFLLVVYAFYWVVFFKWQGDVFILLPVPGDYKRFVGILVAAFFCQLAAVIHLVVSQCSVDMFFIDWEQSRGLLLPKEGSTVNAPQPARISSWRTFFVANEWNELQSTRRINIQFTLFALLLLLEGFGLSNLATPQPAFRDLDDGTHNLILRFAVSTFLWLAVVLGQHLYNFAIGHRFLGDPAADFVDLISLSNISVFVLEENYKGYYLHGRSVHPFADVDMAEMGDYLEQEEGEGVPLRGLEGRSQQTFEVYVTSEFKDHMAAARGATLRPTLAETRLGRSTAMADGGRGMTAQQVLAYKKLNGMLTSFIDRTHATLGFNLREKTFQQRLLAHPPDWNAAMGGSHFYDAGLNSFTSVLFYGAEIDLLLFNILVYSIADLIFENVFVAVVLTYLVEVLLVAVRSHLGEANLVKKTLVDRRFLI